MKNKITSLNNKGKTAQANLNSLVNNRQTIAFAGAYLITEYAELNDLNVAHNHPSWQQLISVQTC